MRKLILWIVVLAAWPRGALLAQSLAGTWQGSIQPPQSAKGLRIVIKISTTDGDTLKALLYSIDQGAQPIPAGSITLQGSTVRMSVPGVGGAYEGRLSADGNSIAGSWTQGTPLPLNLTRATSQTEWTISEAQAPPKPMPADANAVFEVATIKPSRPDAVGKGFRVQGRSFSTMNTSLSDLVTFAYRLHARQLTGAPSWVEADKYDISAKPDSEGQPNEVQWKVMVQKLLADRFKLSFHRDKKELAVYTITVAKTGPKLTKSAGDPNGLPALFFRGLGALPARNATMADLAGILQSAVLDRPVVDQTGLSGRYDFTLNWTPDEFQFSGLGIKPPPASDANPNSDLFTAMQQQLGLKLEAAKALAEILVVDHVEKPSEN